MNLFYCTDIIDEIAILSEEESIHCTRVLRKRVGDEIIIIDGKGLMCKAELTDVNKKGCKAKITETLKKEEKRDFSIHIAIAPTKNISRIEWFLEKATEIGIDEVSFILTEHSERKKIRLDRLEKIVLSATKQSLKATLPKLNELVSYKQFLAGDLKVEQKFIAWVEEDTKNLLRDQYKPSQSVCILIGPEGGFSEKEVELARDSGFDAISLGESRLRTETAGIHACVTIDVMN